MKDAASQLRSATRRAKSDVANKLVSMFLHEFSRKVRESWPDKVDGQEYVERVRECFKNRCPYCSCDLAQTVSVIEHLDGMNRFRAGLHAPGNVLVSCRRCNSEKRRDDSLEVLSLAATGWESFLSHDGSRCSETCRTCNYWQSVWEDEEERKLRLRGNLQRIRTFRSEFPQFEALLPSLTKELPRVLTKLHSDCQRFAEKEIRSLLQSLEGRVDAKS